MAANSLTKKGKNLETTFIMDYTVIKNSPQVY